MAGRVRAIFADDKLRFDNRDGEAVVAFYADGLDGCAIETRVFAEFFKEDTGSDDSRVGVGGIDDGSVADDIIGDDEGPGAGQFDGPIQVMRIVGLIGIKKDEVEGRGLFSVQRCKGIERRANANVYAGCDTGPLEIGARDGGVFWFQLERDQLAVRRKCLCQPDGRVSAERAHLEDTSGSLDTCEKMKQLALIGSDIDGGKTSAGIGIEGFRHVVVGCDEGV